MLLSLDLLVSMQGKKHSPSNGGLMNGGEFHGIESVKNHLEQTKTRSLNTL